MLFLFSSSLPCFARTFSARCKNTKKKEKKESLFNFKKQQQHNIMIIFFILILFISLYVRNPNSIFLLQPLPGRKATADET